MVVVGNSTSTNGDVSGNNGYEDVWVAKLEADAVGIAEGIPVSFSVHPNPSTGILRLDLLEAGKDGELIILDSYGREVSAQQMKDGSIDLDLSALAKGVYVFSLCSDEGVWSERIVLE